MPALTTLQTDMAVRIMLAAVCGAAVGLEREVRDQAAGLRTHMLVSVGACLFALVSAYGFEGVVSGLPPGDARYDVSRVASNIVTGVGFLGAGAIIRHGLSVKGLTTAASMWVVAAIGAAVALGMYWATAVTVVITILSLLALRPLRRRVRSAALTRETLVLRSGSETSLDRAFEILVTHGYRVRNMRMERGEGVLEAYLELSRLSGALTEDVTAALGRLPGITEIAWDEPGG